MKQIIAALVFSGLFSFTAHGAAAKSACEQFASDRASWEPVRTVAPSTDTLHRSELAMIQTAVLSGGLVDALTPDEALAIFTDRDNGGSLGGDIRYFEVLESGRKLLVALVTYYPGDNEYGALFRVREAQGGDRYQELLATIGDSDVYCLTYRE